jgi:hypothetical protein
MAGRFDTWSKTAATNATVDATISWGEGQLPSTVNNSARAEMAALASFRDDINGTLTTAGSSNAYTLTSNIGFTAYATGLMVAFKANHANTGAATLNVNGIGAKALRTQGDQALLAGQIAINGQYVAKYDAAANSAAGAWLVQNASIRISDEVNVKYYGAVGDGSTDDTSAFQAAFDVANASGGQIFIPPGDYVLTSAVTFEYAATLTNGRGLSIRGCGPGVSIIRCQHTGAAFSFTSSSGIAHSYGKISGLKFYHTGAPSRSGTGILADNIAYWTLDDLLFYNLEYAVRATDILNTTFNRVVIRTTKYGVYLEGQVDASPPNSVTFNDCVLSEIYEWGLQVIRPRLLRLRGGSFEAIGINGGEADKYSVKIMEPRGPIAAVIDGVYFTNNKGQADVWVDMISGEPNVLHIDGSQFTRIDVDNYVTNHIYIESGSSDANLKVVLTGNAFLKLNDYSEDAAETYVAVDGDGPVQVHDNGNHWQTESLKGAAISHLAPGRYVIASMKTAPVSHTGDTNETALATITIPANTIGIGGHIIVKSIWGWTNSANNKTIRTRLGGISGTEFQTTVATTTVAGRFEVEIANQDAANDQVSIARGFGSGVFFGVTSGALEAGAIDTTVEQDLVLSAQLANTGETITLHSYTVELIRAP